MRVKGFFRSKVERVMCMLDVISTHQDVDLSKVWLYTFSHVRPTEGKEILEFLERKGWIKTEAKFTRRVTPEGWEMLKKWKMFIHELRE